MIRVGYETAGYRERRNVLDLPHDDVRFVRVRGLLAPLAWLAFHARGRSRKGLQHRFVDPGFPAVDLLHLFFSVSTGRRPWVVSSSSWMPRWGKTDRRGHELLAGEPCRAVLAVSEYARRVQAEAMERHPRLAEAVAGKTTVVLPAQRAVVADVAQRELDPDHVDVAFVGHQLFRKGGDVLVRVVSRLLDEGLPLRLHVVSRLDHGDYASRSTPADVAEVRALMARHPRAIRHVESLPGDGVLDLFRRSHLAALPTRADTFGYVVLEAQACGCPVLSTNVQALPEVNDDDCGWLLDVPRWGPGRALRRTEEERAAFDRALEERLEETLRAIVADPEGVGARSARALERVRLHHDPAATAATVRGVYREAIGR